MENMWRDAFQKAQKRCTKKMKQEKIFPFFDSNN